MNDSFIFYQTFWQAYMNLKGKPTENGKYNAENEMRAYKFLELICKYGIEGKYEEGDPYYDALMASVVFGIDRATDRYNQAIENGKKGGAPPKYDKQAIVEYVKSGHTHKEASERFKCNIRTVGRYMSEDREEMKKIVREDGSYYF